jgi:hypothetical protein
MTAERERLPNRGEGDAFDWIEGGGTADEFFRLAESSSNRWAEYKTPKGEVRSEAITKTNAE